MIKINSRELAAIIDEETVEMRSCSAYTKSEAVIGEVNEHVVVLTIMTKPEACNEFGDYEDLNLVTDDKD